MMLRVAIEISNPTADGPGVGPSVALERAESDGTRVDIEPLGPPRQALPGASRVGQGGHDDDLMPAIDRLFARNGVMARDLAGGIVAVSVGPGGYTGLRIACAAGKMIAEGAGAKCVAVPTALALARAVADGHWARGLVAVSLAGKGESSWVEVFDRGERVDAHGRLMTSAEVAGLVSRGVRTLVTDRFLPAAMRVEAERIGVVMIEPEYDARRVLELSQTLAATDPVELVPLYPREPDAVTLWRARQSG